MDNSILNLPNFLILSGKKYRINADYRQCIKIMQMFEDSELTDNEKMFVLLSLFYRDKIPAKLIDEALYKAILFLDVETTDNTIPDDSFKSNNHSNIRVFSWTQDLKFIIAGVDKVLNRSCRRLSFLHWWEFYGAFLEIGECTFTTLIHQRKLKKTGKQTKEDKKWWTENKDIAELKIENQLTFDERKALERFNELLKGDDA